jgi:O-antigen/teichoic acid export membrane protein
VIARVRASQFVRHGSLTFGGVMAANVLGYAFYALVSRSLGVEGYGTFAALVSIVLILAAPAQIAQIVTAKLASDFAGDRERLAGLVRAIDRLTVLVAGAAAAALAAAAVPLAAFLHLADPLLVVLAAFSLGGAIALPFLRGVLQGTLSFRALALSLIAENFGKSLFAPVLALAAGLRGAMVGMALGLAASVTYTFVTARPHGRGSAERLSLRDVLGTSASVALAVSCISVLVFFDGILAKRYFDAYTAGIYGAVALASRAVYAVVAFVPIVLLPQAATRSASGERTRGLFLQAFAATVAICAAACALYWLAPRFVMVFVAGRAFAPGAPLLPLYVAAISALAAANVIATYNIARGRMRFVLPLACVVAGEVISVVVRHRGPGDLLQTIVVGHTLALLACATSLGRRTNSPSRE